jgi:hypothetical protein
MPIEHLCIQSDLIGIVCEIIHWRPPRFGSHDDRFYRELKQCYKLVSSPLAREKPELIASQVQKIVDSNRDAKISRVDFSMNSPQACCVMVCKRTLLSLKKIYPFNRITQEALMRSKHLPYQLPRMVWQWCGCRWNSLSYIFYPGCLAQGIQCCLSLVVIPPLINKDTSRVWNVCMTLGYLILNPCMIS